MIKPTAELDVVVVNYNSGSALAQCIQTITQFEMLNLNVVVIDNHSSDQSMTALEDMIKSNGWNVNTLYNNSNLGFAKACNQGASTGQTDYIAFINPDCFINGQQLLHLKQRLSENTQAGLIGCRVLNPDMTLQAASRRRLPTFWRIVFHLTGLSRLPFFTGIHIKDQGLFDSVVTVEAVNGACLMVKRTAFQQVGGYDENYPLHFEDLDLFATLQCNNKAVLYDSSVQVVHLHGHSDQQVAQVKAWKRRGLLLFMQKHRPKWEYKISRFFLGLK